MDIKTVGVQVNRSRHCPARCDLAGRLATQFDAHLTGIATAPLLQEMYPPGMDGAPAAVFVDYLERMKDKALTALHEFEQVASGVGASKIESILMEEEAGAALSLAARYCDLMIIGQNDPEEFVPGQRDDVAEFVIMNSPSPVLILPYIDRVESVGQRALIAWDGSLCASHAIHGALPLLRKASQVQVVVFNAEKYPLVHGQEPGADVALYLARHGIPVEVTRRSTDDEIDVGNALLSHLADIDADLLVMGGYAHSRFRQYFLGGVTRAVLSSMTVPVLMMH